MTISIIDTKKNMNRIRNMALYKCQIFIKRLGAMASSEELVPGDIVEVPEHCAMPCDMILIEG